MIARLSIRDLEARSVKCVEFLLTLAMSIVCGDHEGLEPHAQSASAEMLYSLPFHSPSSFSSFPMVTLPPPIAS